MKIPIQLKCIKFFFCFFSKDFHNLIFSKHSSSFMFNIAPLGALLIFLLTKKRLSRYKFDVYKISHFFPLTHIASRWDEVKKDAFIMPSVYHFSSSFFYFVRMRLNSKQICWRRIFWISLDESNLILLVAFFFLSWI